MAPWVRTLDLPPVFCDCWWMTTMMLSLTLGFPIWNLRLILTLVCHYWHPTHLRHPICPIFARIVDGTLCILSAPCVILDLILCASRCSTISCQSDSAGMHNGSLTLLIQDLFPEVEKWLKSFVWNCHLASSCSFCLTINLYTVTMPEQPVVQFVTVFCCFSTSTQLVIHVITLAFLHDQ